MKLLVSGLVLFLIVLTNAEETQKEMEQKYYLDALSFLDECGSKPLTLCLKEKTLRFLDKTPSTLDVGGILSISSQDGNEERKARLYTNTDLPEEPRAREEVVDKVLTDRIIDYLGSHTIQLKVPNNTIAEFKRSIEEGRGKKKKGKKGSMMPYLLLLKLKATMMAAMAIKAIAALAFKALLIAKIALTISLVVALKKLLEHKHTTSTYEVIAHDDHDHYDRSYGAEMAFKGYKDYKKEAS